MRIFRWLYRLPGRIDRNVEKTVIASSVIQSEEMGGIQVDPVAMNAALDAIAGGREREGDSARAEGE